MVSTNNFSIAVYEHNRLNMHLQSDLILANILVNTSGIPDGWKETDLLQEHLNYWIKV